MNNNGFYLFIVNHEKRVFTVWFIRDDTEVNEKIVEKQKEGKDIRCFTSSADESSIYSKIKQYEHQMNYQYTMDAIIY